MALGITTATLKTPVEAEAAELLEAAGVAALVAAVVGPAALVAAAVAALVAAVVGPAALVGAVVAAAAALDDEELAAADELEDADELEAAVVGAVVGLGAAVGAVVAAGAAVATGAVVGGGTAVGGSGVGAGAHAASSTADKKTIAKTIRRAFIDSSPPQDVLVHHTCTCVRCKCQPTRKTIAFKGRLNSTQFGDFITDKLV